MIFNCCQGDVLFQPPIGFSIATSIRVGNELGAGNPNAAKKASYLAVVCVCKYTTYMYNIHHHGVYSSVIIVILAVFYTVLLLTTKDYIGALFVPNNE